MAGLIKHLMSVEEHPSSWTARHCHRRSAAVRFSAGGGAVSRLDVDTSGDLWTGSCDRPPTRLSAVPADDKRAATSWQLTCGTGQSLTQRRRRRRRLFGILLSADCTELPFSPRFPVKTADSLTFVCLSRLSHRIRAPLNRRPCRNPGVLCSEEEMMMMMTVKSGGHQGPAFARTFYLFKE